MLYADQKTYLVELLMKQDQMSMACSIESRVPLLDHTFVEFAACLLLADRNGAASVAQLDTFVRVMSELSPMLPAAMSVPDVGAEAARAAAGVPAA